MRATGVIFLLLGALAMNDPFFRPLMHAERSIRTLPPTILGNKAVISPGPGAVVIPSIQLQLDHPEDFQLTLAIMNADGTVGIPAIGQWRVEWGSGGATAIAFVDASAGVTIPLHASFLKLEFITQDPNRVDGFACAFVGEHTHGVSNQDPTNTSIAEVDTDVTIPSFARSLLVFPDLAGDALEIIFRASSGATVAILVTAAGNGIPQEIPIPGVAASVRFHGPALGTTTIFVFKLQF